MTSNARCWKPRLAVLAIVTISLTGCATGSSEPRITAVCPPVVEYTREFQARAAEELGSLPDGSAIADMLSDYAVMRDQSRACQQQPIQLAKPMT
jgi:hypothetical protein